jgi:hypothetical protein
MDDTLHASSNHYDNKKALLTLIRWHRHTGTPQSDTAIEEMILQICYQWNFDGSLTDSAESG